jgi:hypothetical protein
MKKDTRFSIFEASYAWQSFKRLIIISILSLIVNGLIWFCMVPLLITQHRLGPEDMLPFEPLKYLGLLGSLGFFTLAGIRFVQSRRGYL